MEDYNREKEDTKNNREDSKVILTALENYSAKEKVDIINEILGYNLDILENSRHKLEDQLEEVRKEIEILRNRKNA